MSVKGELSQENAFAQWQNRIICADNLAFLKSLPDECIDMVCTSPPYNFGKSYSDTNDALDWSVYFEQLFAVLDECVRVLKDGGRMAINIMPSNAQQMPTHHRITDYLMQKGLLWKAEIIWNKNHHNCPVTLGSWASPSSPYIKYTHEFVEVFCKGTNKKKGDRTNIDITSNEYIEWTRSVWNITPETHMKHWQHPAMFPKPLVQRILKLFSYQGDTILDPYNGVGTTTVVAQELKRQFIGVDISESYCETARKRLA